MHNNENSNNENSSSTESLFAFANSAVARGHSEGQNETANNDATWNSTHPTTSNNAELAAFLNGIGYTDGSNTTSNSFFANTNNLNNNTATTFSASNPEFDLDSLLAFENNLDNSQLFGGSNPSDPLLFANMSQFDYDGSANNSLFLDSQFAMHSDLDSLLQEISQSSSADPSFFTMDPSFLESLSSSSSHLIDTSSSSRAVATSTSSSSFLPQQSIPVVSMMAPMILAPNNINTNNSHNDSNNRSTKKVGGGRKKRTSVNMKLSSTILSSTDPTSSSSLAAAQCDDPDELTDSETVVFSSARNPTEVFSQAAIKASTRRRTIEEPISCILCSTPIGVLELRGTPASFEAAYSVNIRCKNCCPELLDYDGGLRRGSLDGLTGGSSSTAVGVPPTTSTTTPANRKRRAAPHPNSPSDEILACQVCKRVTAQGYVKMRPAISSPIHKPLDTVNLPPNHHHQEPNHPHPHHPHPHHPLQQQQQPQEPDSTWVTPNFSINLICKPCHTKYLFCSECGGGGKQRTGKYRPRALFPANRRTCSLPHIRIGTTQVQHRVLEAPLLLTSGGVQQQQQQDDDQVLEGVRDVFFDCLVSLYAVPGVLEGVDEDSAVVVGGGGAGGSSNGVGGGSTLARIHADVERLWSGTVRDAIVSDVPKGLGGGKIYVTVAWIEKRNRNKGKYGSKKKKVGGGVGGVGGGGVGEDGEERIPWLLRLAMEGTVAPLLKDVGASSSASLPALAAAGVVVAPPPAREPVAAAAVAAAVAGRDTVPFGEEKTYVSFSVSEWDRTRGALFVLQMAPRSVYLPTMESYGDLLRRNIERVQADSRRDNSPPLEHIWCWTRDMSHSRLRSIPERLGFVPLEQYMREHPGVDRATFEREGYPPLQEDGVSVHVTTVRRFMQLIKKKAK